MKYPRILVFLRILLLLLSVVDADRKHFTIFFKTRNHDVLDQAIEDASKHKAPYLTKEEVRDITGISHEDINFIQDVLDNDIGGGGRITRLATLRNWAEIEFDEGFELDVASIELAIKEESTNSSTRRKARWSNLVAVIQPTFGNTDDGSRKLNRGGRGSKVQHPPASKSGSNVPLHHHDIGTMRKRDLQQGNSAASLIFFQDSNPAWGKPPATIRSLNISKGDSIKNLAAWQNVFGPFFLMCPDGTFEKQSNDSNCTLSNMTLTMRPVYITDTNETDTISLEGISHFRSTCNATSWVNCESYPPDTYIYNLPIYKFAKPNVLYKSFCLGFATNDGTQEECARYFTVPEIINYFNASISTIRELYGIDEAYQGSQDIVMGTSFTPTGPTGINTTAVQEYLDLQMIEHEEIRQFIYSENQTTTCIDANGTNICIDPSETMLDVQAIQSMIPKALTYFAPGVPVENDNIQSVLNDTNVQEAVIKVWTDYFEAIMQSNPLPDVISWSWSSAEAFFLSVGSNTDVMAQAEDQLKLLASMGISIVVSSGDSGASGAPEGCYPANYQTGQLAGNSWSAWPTMSPWVTSVGGTQLVVLEKDGQAVEIVCSSKYDGGITPGGGFSGTIFSNEYFGTPLWQKSHVENYLSNNSPQTFPAFPTNETIGYNPNGRGYPDISAYAAFFPILAYDGSITSTSGTSLAAPLVAGMIGLANDVLVERGYSKIGYANPMLYWMADNCPDAFNDITLGDNQAGENGVDCSYGYPAAPGWDPATGLGTINFDPFVECAMEYQDAPTASPFDTTGAGGSQAAGGGSSPETPDSTPPNASTYSPDVFTEPPEESSSFCHYQVNRIFLATLGIISYAVSSSFLN